MTSTLLPPLAVQHDKKVASLAAFALAHLPHAGGAAHADTTVTISLIARAPDSAIAQALLQIGDELAARRVTVRVVFAVLPRDADAGCWTSQSAAVPFARDVRWARNPRYIDGHEQLVLGPAASWIGDCMRRDPARRDMLEQSKGNCAATAALATASFAQFWRISEPIALRMPHIGRVLALPDLAQLQVLPVAGTAAALDKNQS